MPSRCNFSKIDSIWFTKTLISCTVNIWIFLLRRATYSSKFISDFSMKRSNVRLYFLSSLSRLSSSFRRCPSVHPTSARWRQSPKRVARLLLLIFWTCLSTSRLHSLYGISLTITAILVSMCSYNPTKYLLLLMSCLYSNSSKE